MHTIKDLRLNSADGEFLKRAIEACSSAGPRAVLLLVGSRAAGYAGPLSDLDLWIIGERGCLTPEQQRDHDSRGGLFVDRGDLEAHWHFYDETYLAERLGEWPSEMMWILSTARFLSGHEPTFRHLEKRFGRFPRSIAESKLQWLVGQLRAQPGALYKASASGRLCPALIHLGQALDSLCRICCVAECRPWPYSKWLAEEARSTRAGQILLPFIERCSQAFMEMPYPAPDVPRSQWPPRQHLIGVLEAAWSAEKPRMVWRLGGQPVARSRRDLQTPRSVARHDPAQLGHLGPLFRLSSFSRHLDELLCSNSKSTPSFSTPRRYA